MNGEITSVPAGYAHKTIFVVGDGATNAMDRFGTLMRSAYNTHKADGPDTEITVNWLGYWCTHHGLMRVALPHQTERVPVCRTDNGAYCER